MKFIVTLDRDEDRIWSPAIPGGVSHGKPKEETLANIQKGIEIRCEVRAELGLPLTIETKQIEVPDYLRLNFLNDLKTISH